MKIRILIYLFFSFCLSVNLSAQEEPSVVEETTPEEEQNKSWQMGTSSYPAKPKNAWEIGVNVGHFFIDGDVDRTIPGGYGLGLHLRKAINYTFSLRGELFYGSATGLDPQLWTHSNFGGGLVERGGFLEYEGWDPYANNSDGWFPSYRTQYGYMSLQTVFNIGNILFHKDRNKWNWYGLVGAGLSSHRVGLNLLDANNQPYTGLRTIFNNNDFDTRSGRSDIKEAIRNRYDDTYETEGFKKAGIFRLGDEINIHVVFNAAMGISRKINKRINLGLEHMVMLSDNDYLDGIKFRTANDQTNNADISHFTSLRIGINLGNFNKVSEPLYWLNPLEAHMNDIAALKQRPVLDLTDSDSDGVIDMLDQEPNSPIGAIVDTRGITLDSDGDSIPDYLDKEPYSPPGYPVDKDGVANVPCCITKADIDAAIDARSAEFSKTDCGKWFLPMIHFDAGRSKIKPDFYGHLHHVNEVMTMCPDLCITVHGVTDGGNSDALAYDRAASVADYIESQYGIDRSRIKVMFGPSSTPPIPLGIKGNYMNRRVDIRVCGPNDTNMEKPKASSTIKGTGTSRKVGDKNSGF